MNNKSKWDSLSLKEKSEIMKMAISSGVMDLNNIRASYNSYAEGGPTETLKSIVEDAVVWGADKILDSNLIPEKTKQRLLEFTMRISGGNSDEDTKKEVIRTLASKEGINLLYKVVTEDTPVSQIIAGNKNNIDNYTGFAMPSDQVDPDIISFLEQHPNDADFVDAYSKGVIPFESAGVFKIEDNDSTRLGRYTNYIDKHYQGKYIPTYQGHKETLNQSLVDSLNIQSNLRNTSTFGVNAGNDLPFEFGYNREESSNPEIHAQGYYDAAGYNLELIRGKDGKIYGRKSDMYDFMPKHYTKLYTPEASQRMKNLVETVDNIGNPFIFRSPWFEVNSNLPFRIPDNILEEFNKYENENK